MSIFHFPSSTPRITTQNKATLGNLATSPEKKKADKKILMSNTVITTTVHLKHVSVGFPICPW